MYTPALQLNAWYTSGIVVARRPPKMIALIGTPFGSSHAGSMVGHCDAGAVKRELGCAALAPVSLAISGVHCLPCQSRHSAGGSSVMPSHHTPPSGVSATLVKIVLRASVAIAFGLVFADVPGATPKKPASGLIARKPPVRVRLNPGDVVADRPDLPALEALRAESASRNWSCRTRWETPPPRRSSRPSGSSTPTISMCSAIQPSSRAMFEAIRSAKHFLPSSALPP